MTPRYKKRREATGTMLAKHFLARLDDGILFDRAKGTTHNPKPIAASGVLRKKTERDYE